MKTRSAVLALAGIVFLSLGSVLYLLIEDRFGGEIFFSEAKVKSLQEANLDRLILSERRELDLPVILRNWQVPRLASKAKALFVYDLKEREEVFGKNEEQISPIASLTKLMTALLIWERGELDDWVKISPESLKKVANSHHLDEGEEFRVRDLVAAMLISSNNEAAYNLAQYLVNKTIANQAALLEIFGDLMNERARELGLKNTHFANPVGFDDPENFSTAQDLAYLADYLFRTYPEIFKISSLIQKKIFSKTGKEYLLKNTNEFLLKEIPGIYGSKTGLTQEAKGCMLLIKEIQGRKLIFVVLGAEDREREMRRLIEWTTKAYNF